MQVHFTIPSERKRQAPKGGQLASLQRDHAAAAAAFAPSDKERERLTAERRAAAERLTAIGDEPDTVEEIREQEALQTQYRALTRQLDKLTGPGSRHDTLARGAAAAARELQHAQGTEATCRAQIAELLAQLAPLMHDLYGLTGDPRDLRLDVEVTP